MAYEIRVSGYRPGRYVPSQYTFNSESDMWKNWEGEPPNPEDGQELDFTGLTGVLGLAEATAREFKADGCKKVVIERRQVGPWEEIERDK